MFSILGCLCCLFQILRSAKELVSLFVSGWLCVKHLNSRWTSLCKACHSCCDACFAEVVVEADEEGPLLVAAPPTPQDERAIDSVPRTPQDETDEFVSVPRSPPTPDDDRYKALIPPTPQEESVMEGHIAVDQVAQMQVGEGDVADCVMGANVREMALEEQAGGEAPHGAVARGRAPDHERFGPFYISLSMKRPGLGAWQALCPFHALNARTKCSKSMQVTPDLSSDVVKNHLRAWCLQAVHYTRKRDHGAVNPHTHTASFATGSDVAALGRHASAARSTTYRC